MKKLGTRGIITGLLLCPNNNRNTDYKNEDKDCSTAKPLKIEELIVPELKKGQVFVDVMFSGICHSHLCEVRGMKGEDRFLPHTLEP